MTAPVTPLPQPEASRKEKRQRVTRRVREAIWRMRSPEDMEGLLNEIRTGLVELDIPLLYCGVNVIACAADPPSVVSHSMNPQGVWHRLQSVGARTVLGFWEGKRVVYRRDLARDDPYDEHRIFPAVGCIIDVPFSHGTLAANSRQPNAFSEEDVEHMEEMALLLEDGFRRLEELRQLRVRHRVREQVWRMQSKEDIVQVMATVRESLEELGYPFASCAINLVGEPGGVVQCHNMMRASTWTALSERPEPLIESVWRSGRPAYRRDLEREDVHGELFLLRAYYQQPIRCVIDVPFSHGTLALNSTAPEAFTDDQVDWLQDLARLLEEGFRRMDDLRALEEHNRALEREVAERRRAEEQLAKSLEENVVLLKEIHHRVKNNLQVVSSLLSLRAGQIEDPAALASFEESRSQIRAMSLIHEKLYESQDLAHIDGAEYVRALAANVFSSYKVDPKRVKLVTDVAPYTVNVDTAIHCGLIVHELVTNSLKYAFPDGRAGTVRLEGGPVHERLARLRVSDDGVGLPAHVHPGRTRSLGLRLVDDLTRQLHGTVEVDRRAGTAFEICFPLQP